jgi:hypothetical protein
MRKFIYFALIIILIYTQAVIVMSIDNDWIELLVLPIICGGSAGCLFIQALKECREETREEMILLALEQMLKDAEEEIEERDEQL